MKTHIIPIILILVATPWSIAGAHAAGGASCGGKFQGETLYSGRFQWKDPATGNAKDLRLTVSKVTKPGFWDSKIMARITNDSTGSCEAICRADNLTVTDAEDGRTATATSMDLSCKSASLGALVAPATVFFQAESPVLRFGSWLQGYEQASLQIDKDASEEIVKEMRPQAPKLADVR